MEIGNRFQHRIIILGVISIFMFCLLVENALALTHIQYSPKVISLGGSITAGSGSCMGEALSQNPATLVNAEMGVLFNYNNPFGFKGYGANSISLSGRVKGTGLAFIYCGEETALPEESQGQIINNFYNEKIFGAGIARHLLGDFNIGLAFWQQGRRFSFLEEPGVSDAVKTDSYLDIGLTYDTNWWSCGMVIKSIPIISSNYGGDEFRIGFRFGEVERLFINLDAIINKDALGKRQTKIQMGIEGRVQPNFVFRTGIDEDGLLTYGFGFEKKRWLFNYAFQTHTLGSTHFLETGYKF